MRRSCPWKDELGGDWHLGFPGVSPEDITARSISSPVPGEPVHFAESFFFFCWMLRELFPHLQSFG